jgi:hypothetical protein
MNKVHMYLLIQGNNMFTGNNRSFTFRYNISQYIVGLKLVKIL